jgi:hypothetical protein
LIAVNEKAAKKSFGPENSAGSRAERVVSLMAVKGYGISATVSQKEN